MKRIDFKSREITKIKHHIPVKQLGIQKLVVVRTKLNGGIICQSK